MRKSNILFLTGVASIAFLGLSPAAHAADAPSAAPGSEEIVVTAQKKEQNLQSVPEAIQVLSGEQLVKQGVKSINDFVDKVPGLTIVGGGDPGIGKAVIRGVSTGSDRGGVVGIYVDDVAVSGVSPLALIPNFVFDPDLSDVSRVEVLKGPQSTLYGASALGGVIHFVTKKPSLTTTSALLRLDGETISGGGDGYGVRAYLNTPILSDRIGLSVSAFYRRNAGYLDNLTTGQKNFNHGISGGTRAALRIKLSDTIETTFSGIYQNIDIPDQTLIQLNAQGQPVYGETKTRRTFALPISIRYRLASNTTTADLNFATLTNIAAYVSQTNNQVSDFSQFAALAPGASSVGYFNKPTTNRVTDELRLASRPGKFEWLIAGYYLHEHDRSLLDLRGLGANGQLLLSNAAGYNVYTFNNDTNFTERAVFGNVTYHLTSKLEATVGARYSSNKQDYTLVRSGILGVTPSAGKGSDSSVTYLATVSYTPVTNLTLFGRAASAYRPGSTQILDASALAAGINPVYKADTLWNYEAGAKGSVADGKLTFEGSLFYMNWSDIQFAAIINNFSVIQNAGKAHVKGGELTLGYRPIRGLSTSIRAAYTDARLLVNLPAVGAHDGDQLPNSSKWNVAASADYRIATIGRITPTVGASYTYRSSAPSAFANGVRFTLPSYSTLDLRAGLDWKNFSIDLHVDNVTNKYALTSGNFSTGGVLIRPRTYGIGFEAHY